MITGMDRLTAALKGQRSDRIPVFCNLFDQGAGLLGMSQAEYYGKGAHVAEGQLRLREKYGYDNVWSLFYVGKEAELLNGPLEVLYSETGPPNLAKHPISTYEDIHRLEVPDDLASHPAFAETRTCLQLLRNEVGGKYPICSYLTASMGLPILLMGLDKWMELLLVGPASVRDELLAKCSELFRKEVAAHRQFGADCLLYCNPFGSTETIPRKMFDQLAMAWMERDLKGLDRGDLIYYCGSSRFNDVIDPLITRLGFSNFYLSPLSDVAEGKQIVNGRGLTCGVINDIRMVSWTPDEVRQEVKRIIAAGMEGSRFLFGTLVMPLQIPEENITAMMEAAYEYGAWEGRE